MVRIAMLSAWHVHADGYASEFSRMPGVCITSVWDENPERGEEFAKKFGADFEPDYRKLLQRDDVDAVCVTSPTSMHKELIVASANAKKHIFTEKVLALTNEDCIEIKRAVEANGVKFCISFPHRTVSENLFAKKAVEESLIGDVKLMRVRNCHNGSSKGWLPDYFYDESLTGGGAMMDLGAHPMYLIHWIMGKPVEAFSAFTDCMNRGVEDNAVTLFKFENGAVGISETGFVSEVSPFSLELYGTEGTVLVGGWDGGVKLYTKKADMPFKKADMPYNGWIKPSMLPKPLDTPTLQFIRDIQNKSEIVFGIDDGVALTELMVAAYKSHREGVAVKL